MKDENPKSEWGEAYKKYNTELLAFVRDRIPADEADDLLQEAWASYLTTLQNSNINQPRAWLYRVIRNRITDFYRRRSGRLAFQDLTEDFDVEIEETLREIATDLGLPLKTVISRKGYARTRLRALLQTTYDNYFGYD